MARIILIKVRSSLPQYQLILENEGHEVVATAGDREEAVEVLQAGIDADVIVTGNLLYRCVGDPRRLEAHQLADFFRERGAPIVILSTTDVNLANWPNDLSVTIVEDPWSLDSLLSAIDQATD